MAATAPPSVARRRFEGSDPSRLRRFPQHAWSRWLLRLAIAAPFAAIALLAAQAPGFDELTTPNAALLQHLRGVDLGAGARELGVLYPPITTVAALVLAQLPFAPAALGIAGALAAGTMLQRLAEGMRRRRHHAYKRIALIVSLVATPLFAYLVTTDLASIVGLWLFSIGMSDLVRFVAFGNTQAGFRAGLLLAGASLSSPMGIVYVVVAVITTPLIRGSWVGNRARLSNIVVVGFPSAGAFGAAMLLAWAFAGSPLAIFPDGLGFDSLRFQRLADYLGSVQGLALLAPLVAGVVGAIIVRRAAVAPLAVMLVLAVLAGFVFRLLPDGSGGLVYALTLIVTIAVLPSAQTSPRAIAISAIALLQIPFGWIDALARPSVRDWIEVVVGALA